MSETALLPLAESVADGSDVDWQAAEARATTDEQAVIRQLRVLSNLAALHRSIAATPPHIAAARAADRSSPAIGSWAHLSLVARLGGGTFGEVYRAWDRRLEREVALKLLYIDEGVEDPHGSRIAREGRLLARVRHPNVITVHNVEIHEGRVGLCMELVRGTTLEEVLRKQGAFSAREAALIGIDLCRAVAAVHAAGLIHRDIKAQNVMREDGGRIVLMDLGTGRETEADGYAGVPELAGTPLYLAPEIFDGAPASERTDLYSLGVLLYHLVSGSFPVPAMTVDELRDHQTKRISVRLRDARADLPSAFVRVVDRAVSHDAERRYASAGELESDLIESLHEAPLREAPPVPAPSVQPPVVAGIVSRLRNWTTVGRAAVLAAAAVAIAVVAVWKWSAPSAPASIRSIAVLPLKNFSGDPSQDYFADGMTDELIGTLGRLGVNVISRTSAMQFRDSTTSIAEIAKALHVDAVLKGSVVLIPSEAVNNRAGRDQIRLNARLIRAGAVESELWDRTFERVVTDIFGLQREVAQAVGRSIDLRPSSEQERALAMHTAADGAGQQQQFDAFNLTLRGRYYWNMRGNDNVRRALQFFQEAVERDPLYAPAYAGQADVYNILSPSGMSAAEAFPLAKAAARKAIALDPSLVEAQTSLAFTSFIFDHDYTAAEDGYRRVVEANPVYVTGHHWYGEFLAAMGRTDESLIQLRRAQELDPLAPGIRESIGSTLYLARRYDEAIAEFRATLQMNSSLASTYYYLGLAYAQQGLYREATAEIDRGLAKATGSKMLIAARGLVSAMQGDRDAALRAAAQIVDQGAEGEYEDLAFIYAALGERDRAFEFLKKGEETLEPILLWAKLDPPLDPLRSDPRFTEFLRRLRLVR